MSTLTVTTTKTATAAATAASVQPTTVMLKFSPSLRENIETAVNALAQILNDHEHCDDPLSYKIFSWGVRVIKAFRAAPQSNADTDQKLKTTIAKHVNKLMKEILINPLNGLPLRDPVLDRKWVWEKNQIEEFLSAATVSPYDSEPIKATPHLFARAMIAWTQTQSCISESFSKDSIENETASNAPVAQQQRSDFEKMMLVMAYSSKAGQAMACDHYKREYAQFCAIAKNIKKATTDIAKGKQELEAAAIIFNAETQRKAREDEAANNERISKIEQTHKAANAIAQGQIATVSAIAAQKHQAMQSQLNETRNVTVQLSDRVLTLEKQYQNALAQVQHLQFQVDNMDDGCVIS